MQRRDSRKNNRKHDNSRRNKKQKVDQLRQEKMRKTLEACVADENATEVSGLYIQWWKGNFKTETTEFFGPTNNTDWIILLDDEKTGQLNAAGMEVTYTTRFTRAVKRIWWIGREPESMRQSMRINDALVNTGWTVKTDARQPGQLRVNLRMETTVDPERNDAWTALTMAALTLKMYNTQSYQRNCTNMQVPAIGRCPIAGIKQDGLRIMVDVTTGKRTNLANVLCLLRNLKFQTRTSEGVFKLAPHDFLKILSKSKPLNYHLLLGFVQ